MNPRSDLVKLFICSTNSLQAALHGVTGSLSKVVGSLKRFVQRLVCQSVIGALILILFPLTHFSKLHCIKILQDRSHRSSFAPNLLQKFQGSL